jgi:hypothetical protein
MHAVLADIPRGEIQRPWSFDSGRLSIAGLGPLHSHDGTGPILGKRGEIAEICKRRLVDDSKQ